MVSSRLPKGQRLTRKAEQVTQAAAHINRPPIVPAKAAYGIRSQSPLGFIHNATRSMMNVPVIPTRQQALGTRTTKACFLVLFRDSQNRNTYIAQGKRTVIMNAHIHIGVNAIAQSPEVLFGIEPSSANGNVIRNTTKLSHEVHPSQGMAYSSSNLSVHIWNQPTAQPRPWPSTVYITQPTLMVETGWGCFLH